MASRLSGICCMIFLFLFTGLVSGQTTSNSPLTLEQAVNLALTKNNVVRSAKYGLEKAEWDKRNAWSQLLPSVTFNSRFSRIDDSTLALRDFSSQLDFSQIFPGSNISIPKTVWQETWAHSIDMQMSLFNSEIYGGLFSANEAENIAIHSLKSIRDQITFQVISAYLEILKTEELLKIQQQYLELSKKNLDKAERMYKADRYSKNEFLRWKVDYQTQLTELKTSEANLRNAKTVFNRLVNRDLDTEILIDKKIPVSLKNESGKVFTLSDDEILALINLKDESLVSKNSQLSAMKSQVELQDIAYKTSYGSYLPNISVSYSYGWFENNTIAFDDYSPTTLMVNFSMPIFSGFKNITKVKSNLKSYKQSVEDFEDSKKNTRYLLTSLVNRIITLKAQQDLINTNVELNENNYRIAETQREKGLVSNIELIDAKLQMQNAKISSVNVNYDFISSVVELYYMLGKVKHVL